MWQAPGLGAFGRPWNLCPAPDQEPSDPQVDLALLARLKITLQQGGQKTRWPEGLEKYFKVEFVTVSGDKLNVKSLGDS